MNDLEAQRAIERDTLDRRPRAWWVALGVAMLLWTVVWCAGQ